MTSPQPSNPTPSFDLPEDLRAVASGLDRLAQSERGLPGMDFESRLVAASSPALTRDASAPLASPARLDERVIVGSIARRFAGRMRLAAAVLLAAGVGIAVLSIWGFRGWGAGPASTLKGPGTLAGASTQPATPTSMGTSPEIDTMLASIDAVDALVSDLEGETLAADSDWDASALHDVMTSFTTDEATQ